MLIDSAEVLRATFQRCRQTRGKPDDKDLGEILAVLEAILSVVDHQERFVIDVPESWVPNKWGSAVTGDTQRGLQSWQALKISDREAFTPQKRRQVALLHLLVRELQRLWRIGDHFTVSRLGHAFHNVDQELRTWSSDTESSMITFRVISADWDMLSLDMREACCRVMGLERQEAEELITTPEFAINRSGPRRFKVDTLLARSTALHDVTVVGRVTEIRAHPPTPVGDYRTIQNAYSTYSMLLEDETGSIDVEVIDRCPTSEPVLTFQDKRCLVNGIVEVLGHGVPGRPLVRLITEGREIHLVTD